MNTHNANALLQGITSRMNAKSKLKTMNTDTKDHSVSGYDAFIIKKYERYILNIEWHIKTNKPDSVELEKLDMRLGCYKEALKDLQSYSIQSTHEPIKDEELIDKAKDFFNSDAESIRHIPFVIMPMVHKLMADFANQYALSRQNTIPEDWEDHLWDKISNWQSREVTMRDRSIYHRDSQKQKAEDSYQDIVDYVQSLIGKEKYGWIDVNDRLPEYDVKVLVVGEQFGMNPQMGGPYICIVNRQDLSNTSIAKDAIRLQDKNQFRLMAYVTHWQPLPKLPNQ